MVPIHEPSCWPNLPPWWLISATEVAALLGIRPRELMAWRTRGFAPPAIPPMYLKPTQGMPLWHQFGAFRRWVADQTGSTYDFTESCETFLAWAMPVLIEGTGTLAHRVEAFEALLDRARKDIVAGRHPVGVSAEVVHALDVARSRQPMRIGSGPPKAFLTL